MQREERSAQGQRTRATIVRAAAQEIGRRGYAGTSLSDIAAVFGKPKTALRYHFGSKAELAIAVSEYQNGVWVAMVEEARQSGRTGLAGVLSLFGAAILDSRREPYASAVLQMRVTRPETGLELPPIPFSWFEVAREYVDEARELGELPTTSDSAAVTRMLLDATFGAHQLRRAEALGKEDMTGLWRHLLLGLGVTEPEAIIARTAPFTTGDPASD